jgi:hypothetical protein
MDGDGQKTHVISTALTGHPFRLILVGPVTHAEFDAAQRGVDPKTGEPVAPSRVRP